MKSKEIVPWIKFEDWQAEKVWTITAERRWLNVPENALAISKLFQILEKSLEEKENKIE